jgi:phage terminase small subunit
MKNKPNNNTDLTLPIAKKLLPVDVDDLNLTLRDYKFIAEYCTNGFKGMEAALSAGFKGDKRTLQSTAWALLKKPQIIEALKRFINTVIEPYKTRLEYEILDRYYRRATYTVDIFYDKNGEVLPLDEIDKEWLPVIDGVERKFYGKDASEEIVTYQLPNRDTALQMLAKLAMGVDPNSDKLNQLPQETRSRLQQIFNAAIPLKTGAESPGVKTTTRLTVEQVVQTGRGEAGRPRKYCKMVKGQPCVRCNRCKTENMINVTPDIKGKKGKK